MDENNLQNPDAEKSKERVEAEKKYEQKKQVNIYMAIYIIDKQSTSKLFRW